MAYSVKFPLGKYASAWAAAKQGHGRVRWCMPISARERGGTPISVRDGTAKLLPGCRAGPTLGVLAALKYHSLLTKIYQFNPACLRESNIIRFQANIANTNLYRPD